MEKQEKPIDKDKNEKLKALLSLYAKPMVNVIYGTSKLFKEVRFNEDIRLITL